MEDGRSKKRGNWFPWAILFALLLWTAILLNALETVQRHREPHTPNASDEVPLLRQAPAPAPGLYLFEPAAAADLLRVLDTAWALPVAQEAVPNLAPAQLPDDLTLLENDARKRLFLRAVAPHVLAENRRNRALRKQVVEIRQHLMAGRAASDGEITLLGRLAEDYRVEIGADDVGRLGVDAMVEQLLDRVDVVPPSLALSQAAIESGWGGSRFARMGNALFGQWVFAAEKGMAPLFRPPGANYSVARFADLGRAVRAYVKNLNTLWAYGDFRALRRQMR